MRVSIGVAKIDQGVEVVAKELEAPLRQLSERLSLQYGGEIEHLLIDVEISPQHADSRAEPWPIRFQRHVSPPKSLPAGMDVPVLSNVAHYSIRPNLQDVPLESVVPYVLNALLGSTEVLERKAGRFPGFAASAFRTAMATEIATLLKKMG
jgi:hypothetical protein